MTTMRAMAMAMAMAAVGAQGCASARPWMPLTAAPTPAATTLVWVGRGECERMENGAWVRRPEYDYEFTVEQRRNGARWDSVKTMRRLHPAYDGGAGERTQVYFFRQDFVGADGGVRGALTSSLGTGEVRGDGEFRQMRMELAAAGVSSFAPFDRYRISQTYDYEGGRLTELVELNRGATPWVRNRETATLYAPHRFDVAPSRVEARP